VHEDPTRMMRQPDDDGRPHGNMKLLVAGLVAVIAGLVIAIVVIAGNDGGDSTPAATTAPIETTSTGGQTDTGTETTTGSTTETTETTAPTTTETTTTEPTTTTPPSEEENGSGGIGAP
jgi:eukaryotic-like serine/threonine-protein kinase